MSLQFGSLKDAFLNSMREYEELDRKEEGESDLGNLQLQSLIKFFNTAYERARTQFIQEHGEKPE